MNSDIFLSTETIMACEQSLAKEIASTQDSPFALLGVLRGCVFFLPNLCKELVKLGVEPQVEMVGFHTRDYQGKQSLPSESSVREIGPAGLHALDGINVIIVDTIVHTGVTVAFLRSLLQKDIYTRGKPSRSIHVATLLVPNGKPTKYDLEPTDYVGCCPGLPKDGFVEGYGLDPARYLPYIRRVR